MDDLGYLILAAALNPKIVPHHDAIDMADGATHIPNEVTDARRLGKTVQFIKGGQRKNSWYWVLPNGDKIYHG